MKSVRNIFQEEPRLMSLQSSTKMFIQALIEAYERGNKLLLCGNGGSSADCDHIVGELMKGFVKTRPLPEEVRNKITIELNGDESVALALQGSLPAISLSQHVALTSAVSNDISSDLTYAQQVLGYGKKGDVFLGISTSGNAKNVYYGAAVAKALGLNVFCLTGGDGGILKEISDYAMISPHRETYLIQEDHVKIYHYFCAAVEEHFFEE